MRVFIDKTCRADWIGFTMLSQTVEYALRAVTHIALRTPEPCTTEEVAATTQVPKAYLSKVLQSLRRAGVLHAQRGVGGGMTLVKSAHELTVLDIVNAVEPIQRIVTCPLGLAAHGSQLCALHRRIDDAIRLVEQAFASTTIAEILAEPNPSFPLCAQQSLCSNADKCTSPNRINTI